MANWGRGLQAARWSLKVVDWGLDVVDRGLDVVNRGLDVIDWSINGSIVLEAKVAWVSGGVSRREFIKEFTLVDWLVNDRSLCVCDVAWLDCDVAWLGDKVSSLVSFKTNWSLSACEG